MAFMPDYYPSKGTLFEPCVFRKRDGGYKFSQLAGPNHDYFRNPAVIKAVETLAPAWSDAYEYYDEDTLLHLTTYTCPLRDEKGRLAAICGLDLDVTWLSDTLNARQRHPSTFTFILSADSILVAGPPAGKASDEIMGQVLGMFKEGRTLSPNRKIGVRTLQIKREPYWYVGQVYNMKEIMAPVLKMRRQQMLLIVLGLAILFFMIERFFRNEKKLSDASEAKARMEGELSVARKIQREMLPTEFPDNIYGIVEPAQEVGGDLFDFYTRDGKLFFCIGDVSGKGVPSAMLMSVIHSLFRLLSQRLESPSFIIRALNEEICRNNDSNMFVTFFVGILDLYTGKVRYCNAGHDKPFFLSSSASVMPVKSNLPLGVFPGTEYEEESLVLSTGNGLFLYTDGLTEAKDNDRNAFGRSRVEEVLNSGLSTKGMTPQQQVNALSGAAHRFAGTAPQSDDLTMLLIKYEPGELVRERIELVNNTDEIARLGGFVKAFCSPLGLDNKQVSGLRLALEETVVNIIDYAYPPGETGTITIYADSNRREVRFTVVDSGIPFDPNAVLSADTTLDVQSRPIGGLGIHLTRKLMDSVSYCRKEGKNVLTLTKSII